MLRLSQERIRQLVAEGKLPARRVGQRGQYLIPEEAVRAMLSGRAAGPVACALA
jgi:excisionase family DNA binding protein